MFMASLRDDVKKKEIMAYSKEIDEALTIVEKRRGTDDDADDLLDACLWPHSVFCREALAGCSERDFRDLAEPTKTDLRDAACGISSKPIEDLHRNLNVKAKQNMNGGLSRHGRWHTAMTCPVLQDNEILMPKPTSEQQRAARTKGLNNPSYKVDVKMFSLGEEVYKDVLTKNERSRSL
jgi:hypothetical protein